MNHSREKKGLKKPKKESKPKSQMEMKLKDFPREEIKRKEPEYFSCIYEVKNDFKK